MIQNVTTDYRLINDNLVMISNIEGVFTGHATNWPNQNFIVLPIPFNDDCSCCLLMFEQIFDDNNWIWI